MAPNNWFEVQDVYDMPAMFDINDTSALHRDAVKALADSLNTFG